jgi:hypothetical protein
MNDCKIEDRRLWRIRWNLERGMGGGGRKGGKRKLENGAKGRL